MAPRLMKMRTLLVAVALLSLAACGTAEAPVGSPSGIEGTVLLGPTCPVETVDNPCPDQPAAGVVVLVKEPGSDTVVAQGRTDDQGAFRIVVEPGSYDLTAEAGMFCKPLSVTVVSDEYAAIDLPCDTGIR